MVSHDPVLYWVCFYLWILNTLNKVGNLVLIVLIAHLCPSQYTVSFALILHLLRPR